MKKKITTDKKNRKRGDVHKGSYRPRGSVKPPKKQPPKKQPGGEKGKKK